MIHKFTYSEGEIHFIVGTNDSIVDTGYSITEDSENNVVKLFKEFEENLISIEEAHLAAYKSDRSNPVN